MRKDCKMNIYLIRHGRQNSKLCNVDVELSPEGREQADLVGKRLQTYHIDVVYSSQLIRAKETADIINKYLNKPRVIEERIQEANFGAMTGMTNEAIDEKYGDYLAQRSTMNRYVFPSAAHTIERSRSGRIPLPGTPTQAPDRIRLPANTISKDFL